MKKDSNVKSFSLIFIFFSLVCIPSAYAQEHVAIVKGRSLGPYDEAIQGIRQSLSQSNGSLTFDIYDMEGNAEKGSQIAESVKSDDTKLVIVVGTEAAQAFKNSTTDRPLILSMVYDPLSEGLADQSNANHYAVFLKVSFKERLSILKKIVPMFRTLGLLYQSKSSSDVIEEAKKASLESGTQLVLSEIDSLDHFSEALEEISQRSQALVMVLDPELYNGSTAKELLLFSARKKYPVIALAPNYVQAGALASISSDFRDNGVVAGKLASKLLKGDSVSDRFIPTEKVRVTWNRRIADVFGISLQGQGEVQVSEVE